MSEQVVGKVKVKSKVNPMRELILDKVSVNIGVGEAGEKLEKAFKVLQNLTDQKPVRTKSNKRIPAWGVRPGLSVGVKVTLRNEKAVVLLKRLLESVEFNLRTTSFDDKGNINFGIRSYIDVPDMKYDPKIGVFGISVSAVLKRKGYSVKSRGHKRSKVGGSHLITKSEGSDFFKKVFGVVVK